jgi:hypothetical protein
MFILYCDGLKIDIKYNYQANLSPSSLMHIGKKHDEGHHFRGSIDELELYNKVVTPSEANDIFFKKDLWINGLITDAFPASASREITWASSDLIKWVKLEFSSGNAWELIADSVIASDKLYTWQTPDIYSNECRIRITDLGNRSNFRITETFSIVKYQWELTSTELPFTPRDGAGALHFNDGIP